MTLSPPWAADPVIPKWRGAKDGLVASRMRVIPYTERTEGREPEGGGAMNGWGASRMASMASRNWA